MPLSDGFKQQYYDLLEKQKQQQEAAKMRMDQNYVSPDQRDASADRADQNALLASLFQSANQAGSIGGKVADSSGTKNFADTLAAQDAHRMQGQDAAYKLAQADSMATDKGLADAAQFGMSYDQKQQLADEQRAFDEKKLVADTAFKEKELKSRSADRSNALALKSMERDAKAAEKQDQFTVPGYGQALTKDDAEKAKKATRGFNSVRQSIAEMKELYKANGAALPGTPAGDKMKQLATDIQLQMKGPAFYELGALSGPDLALMEAIAAGPSPIKEWGSKKTNGAIGSYGNLLEGLDGIVNKYENSLVKSYGLQPEAKQVTARPGEPNLTFSGDKQSPAIPDANAIRMEIERRRGLKSAGK